MPLAEYHNQHHSPPYDAGVVGMAYTFAAMPTDELIAMINDLADLPDVDFARTRRWLTLRELRRRMIGGTR